MVGSTMSVQALSPGAFAAPAPATKVRTRKKTGTATKGIIRTGARKTQSEDVRRTSQILNEILLRNPDAKFFTIEKILGELGVTSFGTSLMFFAIPEVLPIPIPGISAIVVLPTGVLSAQMAAGKREIRLPRFILRRAVPRKALVTAIHAILPVLKKAEKITKPRWKWAASPVAQRALGVFIFLLALAIAFPIPGFNMPQAIAVFMIGLGLVEKDGVVICAGVVTGIASLLLLGGVIFGVGSLLGFGKA